jgi:hypothetical protein
MNNTIKCPKCGKEFEVSEALQHDIEDRVRVSVQAQHEKELAETKRAAEEAAKRKLDTQYEAKVKELQATASDEKEERQRIQGELLESTKQLRKARQDQENAKLEMEKRLAAEEETIRATARKQVMAEHELKDREKDKKLRDALTQVEELKVKIEQGSQQAQGEVMEVELEECLRKEFPDDEITEVKKGQRGGDVLQSVVDGRGRTCGIILWESKNAQWSDGWLKKLREDARAATAQIPVLVSVHLPKGIETFDVRDGVWITARKYVAGLALALRSQLIEVHQQKMAAVGKNEKMDVLFAYLTGTEFRHRVEAIVEGFTNLQQDIEKEKRWFQLKWARQEKELRKIVDNTQGMTMLEGERLRCIGDVNRLRIAYKDRQSVTWEAWRAGTRFRFTTRPVPLRILMLDF